MRKPSLVFVILLCMAFGLLLSGCKSSPRRDGRGYRHHPAYGPNPEMHRRNMPRSNFKPRPTPAVEDLHGYMYQDSQGRWYYEDAQGRRYYESPSPHNPPSSGRGRR
ncbi:MAG: hypothetical protein RBU29_08335 [bacterium]|jgi:hypothetical protein|nr:hypothetical protein [bacterium]